MSHTFSRRQFLKISSAALAASSMGCSRDSSGAGRAYSLKIHDDLLAGHRLFEGQPPQGPTGAPESCQTLIVGGGLAGLAAAWRLRGTDTIVCELGEQLGGSASAATFEGVSFAQGAHYDLEYPAYYGVEVLDMLSSLNVIQFNPVRDLWEFVDTQFLIDPKWESRARVMGRVRGDMLPNNLEAHQLNEALETFAGTMPMPTRLIRPEYRIYDRVTFRDFLENLGFLKNDEMVQAVSYQLRDDFGGGVEQVSALAGIHYYQCRPYLTQDVRVFSPPNGNAWFVDRIAQSLPAESLRTQHLVAGIEAQNDGFLVRVVDLKANQVRLFHAARVIYAGHKHGLPHVWPADAALFADNQYAPWVTLNLVLDGKARSRYWQNDVMGRHPDFLGFVSSRAQFGPDEPSVLTAYFCMPQQIRADLLRFAKDPSPLIEAAVDAIAVSTGQQVRPMLKHVAVKLHGHAMPIPRVGYLFRDRNEERSHPNLVFAGVDNGRLPLLYEALDSGICAVDALTQHHL